MQQLERKTKDITAVITHLSFAGSSFIKRLCWSYDVFTIPTRCGSAHQMWLCPPDVALPTESRACLFVPPALGLEVHALHLAFPCRWEFELLSSRLDGRHFLQPLHKSF